MPRIVFTVLGCLAAGGAALSMPAGSEDPAAGLGSPAAVYSAACAACHGSDGRGQPRDRVGFELELPDFTDCSFATREPDSDWFAVVHQGGPARGFDHRMPAFGQALSAAQLEAAVQHLRTFCEEPGWPGGNLNQPRPMFTEKAFVEDELVLTFGAAVEGDRELELALLFETRVGRASQLEVALPFGVTEQRAADGEGGGGGWVGGLGDVALGFKQVVVALPGAGTIASLIAELVLPTGRADGGIGRGAAVFEPSLTLSQSLGPVGFLHLQAGTEVPAEEDAEVEVFWRAAYGYSFNQGDLGRAWSPMLEVLGWLAVEDPSAVHWDLAPQIQISLSARQHVALGLATRIPVEPDNDRAVGVWAYLLWEWFDGGFQEGW
jgi:mono/diheme cytochrome c family protein